MRRVMDSLVPSFQTSLKISLLHEHICFATFQRNKPDSFPDHLSGRFYLGMEVPHVTIPKSYPWYFILKDILKANSGIWDYHANSIKFEFDVT